LSNKEKIKYILKFINIYDIMLKNEAIREVLD
jgi:hypothetical protein